MEARFSATLLILGAFCSLGASHRTENFIVRASSPQVSAGVAKAAEHFRKQLALEWLGRELPRWRHPCPIEVHVGPQYGAGGATSFRFQGREPIDWSMTIHGSYERVLDSVLPHEVTHTIFATHFGRPLPRWADEGACTTVEHISERSKQQNLLIRFLRNERGIPFNSMFTMTEYPQDMIPLYSQGHSVARYLIMQGGKRKFIEYVWDGMGLSDTKLAAMHYSQKLPAGNMIQLWTAATKKHYGFANLSDLQVTWLNWVKQGRPAIQSAPREAIVTTPKNPAGSAGVADFDPAKPATGQADQVASGNSWYQRHALQVNQEGSKSPAARTQPSSPGAKPPTSPAGHQTPYQPGSIRGAPTMLISRPAPARTPKQTIIQWGRGAPIPPARTTAGKKPTTYLR